MKYLLLLVVLGILSCSDISNGAGYLEKKTKEVISEGKAYRDSVEQAKRYYLLRDIHGRCIYGNSVGDTLDLQEDYYFHCADSLTRN